MGCECSPVGGGWWVVLEMSEATPGMRVGGLIFFAESVEASIAPGMARAIRFGGVIINQSQSHVGRCALLKGTWQVYQ